MSTRSSPTEDVGAYLRECTSVLPEALHEEFVRLPADLAYWNGQLAGAQHAFLSAKVELDILERELYLALREQYEASGVKATERMVEAAMAKSEVWKDAKRLVVTTEAEKLRLGGVLDAVHAKRDALISLGAHVRAEMVGDPRLRDESREFGRKMGFHGA